MRGRSGDGVKICVSKHTASRGVRGHAPRKCLYFRLSQICLKFKGVMTMSRGRVPFPVPLNEALLNTSK